MYKDKHKMKCGKFIAGYLTFISPKQNERREKNNLLLHVSLSIRAIFDYYLFCHLVEPINKTFPIFFFNLDMEKLV